jgi:hypothetical protein
VAEPVRDDDVVLRRVERLAGAEQFAGKGRRQHVGGGAARSMQHQHRLAGRLADRGVVQPQLHGFAGVEFEIPGDPVALFGRRIICGRCGEGGQGECGRQRDLRKIHADLP